MKKCLNCGSENADEMNFCSECGANLKNMPQMVVPLETIQSLPDTEDLTEAINSETETVVGNRYQPPSVPTLSIQKPQNNKMIFAVFGGLFVIIFLIFAAVAAMFYFYIQSREQIVEVKPTPTQTPKKATPTLKPTAKPSETPKETPEETPEDSIEDSDELLFDPPTKPTRQGSFKIAADEKDWQLSEIETVPSQTFSTKVRGTITLEEIGSNITADGIGNNRERRIYKEYPTGALLMRTRFANGKVSNIQPVTASDIWQNSPDEIGRIEFLINDNSPENNTGEFIVSVSLVSVP